MRKLVRENAVRAIEEVIAEQDNDLLQRIYQDEAIGKIIDQISIFKIWHGFSKVDDLSDDAITCLVDFLHFEDTSKLFEYTDYSYLYQEYVDSIENKSTRYQTQQRLSKVARGASAMFQKDLPEMSRQEAMDIAEAMLADTSPTTIYRNILSASGFCEWCIKNKKYPHAKNSFKNLPKVSVGAWVKEKLVKDDVALMIKIRSTIPLNEGYAEPVLLALAWMGFSRQEVLNIKNEDVKLLDRRICGIPIPRPLMDIFYQYDNGVRVAPCGKQMLEWYQEDLGYYLKRLVCSPLGKPFDEAALAGSIAKTGYTFENVSLSRQLYDIYQKELSAGEPPSISGMASDLHVSEKSVKDRYFEIYQSYKSLFWENA